MGDELVLGDLQVVAKLSMGSERLKLFFTPRRILVAHIGKRGVGSSAMGAFFGWLSAAVEDIFRSGRESVSKRRLGTSSPRDILASDKDNFSINYEDIVSVDIDFTNPAASFTLLTKNDKFRFVAMTRRDALIDLLRRFLNDKLRLV
jgi:hypothetical protein